MTRYGFVGVLCLHLFAAAVWSAAPERFILVQTASTWDEASAYCYFEHGTSLATITSDDEARTVMNMLSGKNQNAWIGLNDLSFEGEWEWQSGYECDGDCADLKWWFGNQPSNGYGSGEDCGHLRTVLQSVAISSLLNDLDCNRELYFICDGHHDFVPQDGEYIMGNQRTSWTDADEWCINNHGTNLASIHSEEENTLANEACPVDCWIGAGKSDSGDRIWTDGSPWNYDEWISTYHRDLECGYMFLEQWLGYTEDGCKSQHSVKYPLCNGQHGDCAPKLTGFMYKGFNGDWERVDGVHVGGQPVFKRKWNGYGTTYYMWHETDYSWTGFYDSAWVIGHDYTRNGWYGWKWGSDLFDYDPNGRSRWWFNSLWEPYGWHGHSTEPTVSCAASTHAAAMTISGDSADGPGGEPTDTIPPFPDDSSSSPFPSVMVGAAMGSVCFAATVMIIVFAVKRNRKKAQSDLNQQDHAQHVTENTSSDIQEAAATQVPAETLCIDEVQIVTDAVEVVEVAAPTESEVASAEQ